MSKITIAVDAMGGDFGPQVIVPAAVDALKQRPTLQLILVGKISAINAELGKLNFSDPRLSLVEASQVVGMDDPPAIALRTKKDSSMRVAIELVKERKANACVSAGNTGALMAISRFVLKTLPGIDRPAILFPLPSLKGPVHVLDLGANVDCQAEHLYQFGIMGSVLVQAISDNPKPKVGLLNIGSEAIKGTEQVKRASELFQQSRQLNYQGFVEGDDIYSGKVDVIVCDGFVGNVALKSSEGLAKMILACAKEEFSKNWFTKIAALLAKPVLSALFNRFEPSNYNGGSLLGLKGIVIKSHGSAKQKAFTKAIFVAMVEAEQNLVDKIQCQVAEKLGDTEVL